MLLANQISPRHVLAAVPPRLRCSVNVAPLQTHNAINNENKTTPDLLRPERVIKCTGTLAGRLPGLPEKSHRSWCLAAKINLPVDVNYAFVTEISFYADDTELQIFQYSQYAGVGVALELNWTSTMALLAGMQLHENPVTRSQFKSSVGKTRGGRRNFTFSWAIPHWWLKNVVFNVVLIGF